MTPGSGRGPATMAVAVAQRRRSPKRPRLPRCNGGGHRSDRGGHGGDRICRGATAAVSEATAFAGADQTAFSSRGGTHVPRWPRRSCDARRPAPNARRQTRAPSGVTFRSLGPGWTAVIDSSCRPSFAPADRRHGVEFPPLRPLPGRHPCWERKNQCHPRSDRHRHIRTPSRRAPSRRRRRPPRRST